MDKIVCDTNIFINLLLNDPQTIEATESIGTKNILMPMICSFEILKGASNKKEVKELKAFINCYEKLKMPNQVSEIAFELITKYHTSHNLSIADSLIASSAIFSGLKLFTLNIKDFTYIKGLKLYYPPNMSFIKRK